MVDGGGGGKIKCDSQPLSALVVNAKIRKMATNNQGDGMGLELSSYVHLGAGRWVGDGAIVKAQPAAVQGVHVIYKSSWGTERRNPEKFNCV